MMQVKLEVNGRNIRTINIRRLQKTTDLHDKIFDYEWNMMTANGRIVQEGHVKHAYNEGAEALLTIVMGHIISIPAGA